MGYILCNWPGCTEYPDIKGGKASEVKIEVRGPDYDRGKYFVLCAAHAEQAIDLFGILMRDGERAWADLPRMDRPMTEQEKSEAIALIQALHRTGSATGQ